MALTKCPECSGSVSDLAVACPHCGYPIQQAPDVPRSDDPPTLAEIQARTDDIRDNLPTIDEIKGEQNPPTTVASVIEPATETDISQAEWKIVDDIRDNPPTIDEIRGWNHDRWKGKRAEQYRSRSDDIWANPPTQTEIEGWSLFGYKGKRAEQYRDEVKFVEVNRQARLFNAVLHTRWVVAGGLSIALLVFTLQEGCIFGVGGGC